MKARQIILTALAAVTFGASAAVASESHFTFGTGWWSQSAPEAKFQEFRVVPRGAFLESFLMRETVNDWAVAGWGWNTSRADQGYGFTASRGIRWRADVSYQEIPHLFSQTARSLYGETRPGEYRLPDSLQRTNSEYGSAYIATMQNALASANAVGLSTRTDVTQLRLRARPAQGWRFELRGVERQRNGRQPYSAAFGFSDAIELPVALSQRTTDADAIATYEKSGVRVQASAGLSTFKNDVGTLVVDHPRRYRDAASGSLAGARELKMDLAPDNEVVRGQLALSWRMPRSSVLYGTLTMSEGRQDDDFLPYTSNSALLQSNPDSLPAKSFGGKVSTMTQDLRFITRPHASVSGVLRFHGEKYENDSGHFLLTGFSPYDQGWTAYPRHNHLDGWSTNTFGADVDFELTHWASVGVLGEIRNREFEAREIDKDAETVVGASLHLDPTDAIGFAASIRSGNRELDEFHVSHYHRYFTTDSLLLEQPLLRRFDIANRKQTAATSSLDWTLGPKFDAAVDYSYLKNDYEDSGYGLQRAEEHLVVVDGTFHATPRLDLTGGYGFGQSDTRQASNETATPPPPTADAPTDWWANLRDRTVFVFTRGEWWAKPNRYLMTADYTFTRSFGEYHLTNAANTAQDMPSTYYRRHEFMLGGKWKVNPTLDLSWRYSFDDYGVEDFAAQNIPYLGITGTSATAIYLGDSVFGYRAHRVAFVASKRF